MTWYTSKQIFQIMRKQQLDSNCFLVYCNPKSLQKKKKLVILHDCRGKLWNIENFLVSNISVCKPASVFILIWKVKQCFYTFFVNSSCTLNSKLTKCQVLLHVSAFGKKRDSYIVTGRQSVIFYGAFLYSMYVRLHLSFYLFIYFCLSIRRIVTLLTAAATIS